MDLPMEWSGAGKDAGARGGPDGAVGERLAHGD